MGKNTYTILVTLHTERIGHRLRSRLLRRLRDRLIHRVRARWVPEASAHSRDLRPRMALHRSVLRQSVLALIRHGVGGRDSCCTGWCCRGYGNGSLCGAGNDVVLRFEAMGALVVAGCALDGRGEGAGHAGEGEAGRVGRYGAAVDGGGDHLEEAVGWLDCG